MMALLTASLVFVGVLAIVAAVYVLVLAQVMGRRVPVAVDGGRPALREAWAVATRARILGIIGAFLVGVAALSTAGRWHGLGLVLAPTVSALVCVLAILAGERVIGRRLAGSAAGIEVRRVRDYAPRHLSRAVLAAAVLLLAAIVGGGWFASYGDQFDWTGRVAGGARTDYCFGSRSPFFGVAYGVPVGIVAGVLAIAAALALRAIAARPRNGADPAIVDADDEVRRRASTAVVAASGAGLAGSLAIALANFAITARAVGPAHAIAGECVARIPSWHAYAYGAGAAVAVGLTLWCLARLAAPGSRRPVMTEGEA